MRTIRWKQGLNGKEIKATEAFSPPGKTESESRVKGEHLSLASEPAARSYSSRGTKVGRLSQVSKRMIKTALNVSGHHSHTGQRVLRKTVMGKGSGSGWKKQQKAFSEVNGSRARIPKGSPGPPFFHLNVSPAFEPTV